MNNNEYYKEKHERLAANVWSVIGIILIGLWGWMGQGCKATVSHEVNGGEVVAKVIMEFPQTQACFSDPRIKTFEELRVCLEIVTDHQITVNVDGEIVNVLDGISGTETDSEGVSVPAPVLGGS